MSIFNKEKTRTKRSVDLSSRTDIAIDSFRSLAEKHGASLSRGAAIDAVLGVILGLSPSQAYRLLATAREGLKNDQDLLDAISREDVLSRRDANDTVNAWKQACELFGILADGYHEPKPMRSIQMHGRRILVPDASDWISVNEDNAAESTVATIVEVRNGERFDVPHFIYFDNGESSTQAIDKAVLSTYPRYEEVLKAKVEPVRDSDGTYLNLDELKSAPWPGYFRAQPNDPESGNPYGIMLILDEH